jgi:hypothetical protein
MCTFLEYSVGQHKSTLWTLIGALITMILLNIIDFFRVVGNSLPIDLLLQYIMNSLFSFGLILGLSIAFLIILNCRTNNSCCFDSAICTLVLVIIEMLFYPGLIGFFIWQLVGNVNYLRLLLAYGLSLSYDVIRLIVLSIEQLLLVIYMPLLIVRMGIYLVRCLPCINTRNLSDMCKNNVYPNNQVAPFPQQGPTVFILNQQPMGGVVVQQPMGMVVQQPMGIMVQQPMGMMVQQQMGGMVVQQPMSGMVVQKPMYM